jgi:tetratricopeptide (TPR) repeat protein
MGVTISRLKVRHPVFFGWALVGSLLLVGTARAQAADADEPQPPLEVKHIGPGDRVSVESPFGQGPAAAPAGKPGPKLVPFPEDADEAEAAAQPAPARLAPPKESNFKPRFKTPAVRAAQHAEPAEATEPATADTPAGPQLQPIPVPADPQDSPGRALVDEAFAKSKQAASDDDYTAVIDLCRRGAKAGLKKSYEDYARRLLGWTYNRRGELRERAGKGQEALADFEAAVKCNGNSWRALHNRGVSHASQGRIREALADFNRTIELNKNFSNAYFNRGELKTAQADLAGAIHDYTAALQLSPHDAAILNSRGHAYYRLRQFGEALRDYSDAVKADPAFAAALINRGDTHSDLGRYSDAANDYRAAVEANPKLGKAYQSAAWLMATCPDEHYRNQKLAIDAARKAIELDGDGDYRCLETLAAAQANAGQFGEAKQTQEKAIAKAPRSEAVVAEKRMALYKSEQAYREQPRVAFNPPEDDNQVRKASGAAPMRAKRRSNPGNPQ